METENIDGKKKYKDYISMPVEVNPSNRQLTAMKNEYKD